MANFHIEVKTISRGRGESFTSRANYISGVPMTDAYLEKRFYHARDDVLYLRIFMPPESPERFQDLETFCQAVDQAERRKDARTGRVLIASLPNELTLPDWTRVVENFVRKNFLDHGICAVAAIHHGQNTQDPKRDNPHVHILIPTRAMGPEGFQGKKYRKLDRKVCLQIWRHSWAMQQNRAYERAGLPMRVSHLRLEDQGIRDREPIRHLNHRDWKLEQRGERTAAGDRNREIRQRNQRLLGRTQECSRRPCR